jgi:hypothetical protein
MERHMKLGCSFAVIVAAMALCGAAEAAPLTPATGQASIVSDTGSSVVEVRHGRRYMGNRGRHHGWYRMNRGRHWGSRRWR